MRICHMHGGHCGLTVLLCNHQPSCRRPGDSRWTMAASAFHYVWPAEGTLELRLMLCLLLVLSERVINLAAPIAFKNMVEVLTAVVSVPAEAGQQQHPLAVGLRQLLASVTGQQLLHMQPQQQQQHAYAPGSSSLYAGAHNATNAAAAAAVGPTAPAFAAFAGPFAVLQDTVLAPFWVLFYPWVFVYLGAFFLRGGSGSEGLLANLRDILWIPITQVSHELLSAPHTMIAGNVQRLTGRVHGAFCLC